MTTIPVRLVGLILCLAATGAVAAPPPEEVCDQAAQSASATYQVPLQILMAVARAETGRQARNGLHPWPWTVNLGGEGHWADTLEDAMQIAQQALDEGRLNIDIGCFQLNIRWHSKGFVSLADMFDPQTNADYAAAFLAQLYQESGSWKAAVGAYHSRDSELAAAYVDRVAALATDPPPEPAVSRKANMFPLLMPGTAASAGSLVPQGTVATPLIGAGS